MDQMLQILKQALTLELEALPDVVSDSEDQIVQKNIPQNPAEEF